jgi:hypothetical protein
LAIPYENKFDAEEEEEESESRPVHAPYAHLTGALLAHVDDSLIGKHYMSKDALSMAKREAFNAWGAYLADLQRRAIGENVLSMAGVQI